MKCQKCNKIIDEDSNFCKYCGAKVIQANVCPKCGAKHLPKDAKFCPDCGRKIVGIEAVDNIGHDNHRGCDILSKKSLDEELEKLKIADTDEVRYPFYLHPERIHDASWIRWASKKTEEDIVEQLRILGIYNFKVQKIFLNEPSRIHDKSWIRWAKKECGL